jgi:transcriptional regulator with XRE-family HTH domain
MKNKITNPNLAVLQEFSLNLQKAVVDTGLTPYALSKKLGFDKDFIKNVIRGNRDPKFSTVLRITKGMQVSIDWLVGNVTEDNPVQSKPVSEVEIKKENINFINKIAKMHDQDVELLEAIARILDERRVHAMARLLHAVRNPNSSGKGKKDCLMTESIDKSELKINGLLSGSDDGDIFDEDLEDDLEDDSFDDDEDFDEEEDDDEEDDGDFDAIDEF